MPKAATATNADKVDNEHAYELRIYSKNTSSTLFSLLPALDGNVEFLDANPTTSIGSAPYCKSYLISAYKA